MRRLVAVTLLGFAWVVASVHTFVRPAVSAQGRFGPERAAVGQVGGAIRAMVSQRDQMWIGHGPRVVALDLADPSKARRLGESAPLDGVVGFLAVAEGLAVATTDGPWLHVLDVGDPARPQRVAGVDLGRPAREVALGDGFAYVRVLRGPEGGKGFARAGVAIVDLRQPTDPRIVVEDLIGEDVHALDLALLETGLAVSVSARPESETWDRAAALELYDLRDPTAPQLVSRLYDNVWQRLAVGRPTHCSATLHGVGRHYGHLDVSSLRYPTWIERSEGPMGLSDASMDEVRLAVNDLDEAWLQRPQKQSVTGLLRLVMPGPDGYEVAGSLSGRSNAFAVHGMRPLSSLYGKIQSVDDAGRPTTVYTSLGFVSDVALAGRGGELLLGRTASDVVHFSLRAPADPTLISRTSFGSFHHWPCGMAASGDYVAIGSCGLGDVAGGFVDHMRLRNGQLAERVKEPQYAGSAPKHLAFDVTERWVAQVTANRVPLWRGTDAPPGSAWTKGAEPLGVDWGPLFDIAMDHNLLVAPYALDFPSDSSSTPPIAIAFYDLSATGLVTALGHILLPEPEHLDGLPLVDLDVGMAYVVAAHGDEAPDASPRYQLHVIDASDPTAPRPRGMLDLPARPTGVQARRGHVVLELKCHQGGSTGQVVAEDRADCGIVAVDATDPDAPRFAGRLHPTAGGVWEGNRVALSEDGWAYLAVEAGGIVSHRLWQEDGVLPATPTPEPTPTSRPSPVASPPPPTPGGEKHCARVWLPLLHAAP